MVSDGPALAGTTPGGQPVRFPGFDVLAQVDHWDPVTAGVVLARLSLPSPLRFFTVAEEGIAGALLDHLLDQYEDPRVPVLQMIDVRLTEKQTDGWHYADLPEDGQAWRDSLRAIDDDARSRFDASFTECTGEQQKTLIQAVQDTEGKPWHGMRADRIWSLWTRYACTAFYAHPWAWNEIGFSGPAYPRGYKNPGIDAREPYEVRDHLPIDPTRETS
ncbi:gluconate 2-dehydrogenase subunit 3 family protein [Arthrobacter echini]|uniref:Gluconate 2-dehydrogenase subunit 3 family protein n=1 Tax=Arthrobacter echini TaxID=1529066 RepID=A0A4V3Z650_9MICC|nr:gluconate 2-dehydrogenase subunit 3 family protein [Arthrobacter echini]THJ68599.1 gluconate 2-dehydrogenase subunit 3 family protein [Arthrobacter echini]